MTRKCIQDVATPFLYAPLPRRACVPFDLPSVFLFDVPLFFDSNHGLCSYPCDSSFSLTIPPSLTPPSPFRFGPLTGKIRDALFRDRCTLFSLQPSQCDVDLEPVLPSECAQEPQENFDNHSESSYNIEHAFIGAIILPDEDINDDEASILPQNHSMPFLTTAEMDELFHDVEDDEVIICCDGQEVYSAFKKTSRNNSSSVERTALPYNLSARTSASPKIDKENRQRLQDTTKNSSDIPSSFTMYKTVDRKVKPVPAVFPEDARVRRQFPEDPLLSLSRLPFQPPDFKPNGRLTQERLEEMKINDDGFLWPEEEKLFIHILQQHQNHFVFEDSQRGSFREDYFSPYIIPLVPHVPWAFSNIPIPPGIKDKVVTLLKEKIAAGVYEPSQSSYRSRWFCVLKKNGKLRIVHDLQPLNKVTIRDAGLPPNLDNFVEPFAGRQCYTVFDLYWGFDARKVDPKSRDITAFLTPLGLLRITSLPTGFTNSPAEFQACMTFILQHEIPEKADIFIDDLPIKGPATQYLGPDGKPEVLKENPGIRRFIWEHAQDVHRIVHRVGHAGGTFAPGKVQLARPEVLIVGQRCTPQGRLPDTQKVEKILSWPTLKTVKDVRGFLGLCGTVRIWIENYSAKARPLTELVRQDSDFTWDERREEAFNTLKQALTTAPALQTIDYSSERPVVLSVDSSIIAVGFILSQHDEKGRKRPARYGSLPMNEREARYSQPKLELYGLFRALRAYRLYIIGVKVFHVEVDAKYIKGMLNDPDLQPNATINRWIQGILLFEFELIHVPADRHKGPDGLSRKERAEGEEPEEYDDSWLDDIALFVGLTTTDQAGRRVSPRITPQNVARPLSLAATLSKQDEVMVQIYEFLSTLQLPDLDSNQKKQRFIKKASKFFIKEGAMYRRNGERPPTKCIFRPKKRQDLLEAAHEHLGHRGEQAAMQTLRSRVYWPNLWNDIRHHVRSCHQCQIRSVRKAEVPIMVSTPATIFTKVYVDIMFMPTVKGFKYIVAAKDDLSGASEGRALKKATAKSMSKFLWEEVFCRYGAVGQITTDNGAEVQGAVTELMDRWNIPHIKISAYNSKANGVVERGHFIIREAILKSCKHDIKEWPNHVHHAFFADKVTVRRATNFSPFYLLHGVDPVLPFDLSEASFLVDGFTKNMATEDLLALRIRQLEKRPEDVEAAANTLKKNRLKSKEQFEKRFLRRLVKDSYPPGTLVLVRNNTIEKSMNRKHKPRYNGPYEVVRRTTGGSYILQELDGTVWRQGIAAFRIIPYISRRDSRLPDLANDSKDATDEESSEEREKEEADPSSDED